MLNPTLDEIKAMLSEPELDSRYTSEERKGIMCKEKPWIENKEERFQEAKRLSNGGFRDVWSQMIILRIRYLYPILPKMVELCRKILADLREIVPKDAPDYLVCIEIIKAFEAATDNAAGNKKALLRLPIEVRKLVDPEEYEDYN